MIKVMALFDRPNTISCSAFAMFLSRTLTNIQRIIMGQKSRIFIRHL